MKIRIVLTILSSILSAVPLPAAQQQIVLTAPGYQVSVDMDGYHQITAPGYSGLGVPGYPDLPIRVFYVALPPDVDISSISVHPEGAVPTDLGKFTIRELPPMATWEEETRVLAPYQSVYNRDAFFPENTVEYIGFSRLRKWRIAKIRFSPFQYNPVTRDLRRVSSVTVQVTYEVSGVWLASDAQLADRVMEDRAKDLMFNYPAAAAWYQPTAVVPGLQATNDYAIITTNAIEAVHAAALSDFTTYLTGRGFAPLIVTEDDYGGLTGQAPNGTAEKIRQWLIDNYTALGIKYVLLIGNPDPGAGDIPMKMCWPRLDQSAYQESPTDYFYADLTGNWDLDGDGNFGEYVGDRGPGGVDFVNEVYVGRIPVYNEYPYLDNVLAKIIAYGNSSDTAWRRKALLPESFSDATTDGAYLGEAIVNNYVAPSGIAYHRLYMQGNFCAAANSGFSSEEELLDGATFAHWRSNPYGLVLWWGHGNWFGAYLGYTGCGTGYILNANNVSSLDDSHPAFIYQCSCSNGTPEEPSNLGSLLLIRGAVATVSASRVSWYAATSWNTNLKNYADNAGIGYYYAQQLVTNGKAAGDALFAVKSDMGANLYTYWAGSSWMNLFDFNLYGDPSSTLYPDLVVSGTILDTNNSPIAAVTVNYGSGSVTTDANGFYSILVDPGWSGTVTPSKTGYSFSPASRDYAAIATSSFSQNYARINTTAGVTTTTVSSIATTTATGGGTVLADGGATVTARGVCWSISANPTIANSHTTNGRGTGTFTSNLTSLIPNTLYYVRAYATNTYGTGYGEQLTFTTAQLVFTLSLTAGGNGGGTVTVSGTAHALPYAEDFAQGSQVIIGAVPTIGSQFVGWSGDFVSSDNPATVLMEGSRAVTANFDVMALRRDDLVGTWNGQGVCYRNSDTGAWVAMASPATMITTGDIDADGTDDLIGIWPSQDGVWIKYYATGGWVDLSSTAVYITTGDMNGDGRDDLLGTWDGQGVYYRNSATGAWVLMATPASMITCGDLDNDGTDDLIGIWAGQGGVWVKYSSTGGWEFIGSTPSYIGAGDMNGDGRDELLGSWAGQGVYYRNSETGAWTQMSSEATMITAGDLEGDGIDDLIGLWPTQGGIWVKYSSTGGWELLSSTAQYIAAGKMRPAAGPSEMASAAVALSLPMGGTEPGPEGALRKTDESSKGPGGSRFVFLTGPNLAPNEKDSARLTRVPGPGEPRFFPQKQADLFPVIREKKRDADSAKENAKKKAQ